MTQYKKGRVEWIKLGNRALFGLLGDKEIRRMLVSLIAFENPQILRNRLLPLLGNKRIRANLNGFAESVEQFDFHTNLSNDQLPEANAWSLILTQLEHEKEKVQKFIDLRQKFEEAFVRGFLDCATTVLEEIERDCGESLWLIKSKVLLLSQSGRRDELIKYCNSINDRTKHSLTKYLVSRFQVLLDSGEASFHHESMARSHIKEFSEADRADLVGILRAFCTPIPLISNESPAPTLVSLQRLVTIDTYVVAVEMLAHAAACKGYISQLIDEVSERVTIELKKLFKDALLDRIMQTQHRTPKTTSSESGQILLNLYESGNYADVVRSFGESLHEIKNPAAYINLVAKSLAYLSTRESCIPAPIKTYVDNLADIYSLDSGCVQAQHNLVSEAIRVRTLHLSGYHLQLAIIKALPNRYSPEDAQTIATMAWISSPEATPLSTAIAFNQRCLAWERDYSNGKESESIPAYRRAKRAVLKMIEDDAPRNEIFEKLRALPGLGLLKKDYLEIFCEYAKDVGAIDELVSEAANSLIQNQQAYICLPMEFIMGEIERNYLCSVEAVLVAQSYVRNISNSKSIILNESFEAFIESKGAERPSDLFGDDISTTPLMKAFFRDVCSLDNLDYLSCFSGTTELHAERLAILDWLVDHHAVDTEGRMRELEYLVTRLIQDSAASEFTGPRIFIDEALVHRSCQTEVSVLLKAYKSLPKTSSGFQILPDQEQREEGEALDSYTTGERNTIIFQIWRCVRAAFLFDERNGLAKNLMTEIRHGFFSNLMRARLEEKNLLTETSTDGSVLPNKYWIDACSFVGTHICNNIDAALSNFSRGIKNVIDEAEEIMKITSQKKVTGIYVQLYEVDFELLNALADQNDANPELIISETIELIWRKVESSLSSIREHLNVEFRKRVDEQFEKLEQNIYSHKGEAALHDLMSTIRLCRRDISEDISTTSEWFRRAKGPSQICLPLDDALRISTSSFEKLKSLSSPLKLTLDETLCNIPTSEHRRKALTIALTNLLDNCYRHSGLGRHTEVAVVATRQARDILISVKNNISSEILQKLDNNYLAAINQKFRGEEGAKVLTKRGGTGIGKVYHELSGKAPGSDIYVKLEENQFVVELKYVT